MCASLTGRPPGVALRRALPGQGTTAVSVQRTRFSNEDSCFDLNIHCSSEQEIPFDFDNVKDVGATIQKAPLPTANMQDS